MAKKTTKITNFPQLPRTTPILNNNTNVYTVIANFHAPALLMWSLRLPQRSWNFMVWFSQSLLAGKYRT
jgi:hypothetical protein